MKCLCLTPQQLTVATGSRTISALLWSLLRILEKLTVRYNSNDKTSSPTDCAFDHKINNVKNVPLLLNIIGKFII